MKMTFNETSFNLLKSIIEEDVDAYEVDSTINITGSRFLYLAGNSRAQKLNKAQTKRLNIKGVYYFCRLWYCLRTHQQEWYKLHIIIYPLFITLPKNLRQLPFSPLPLPPI